MAPAEIIRAFPIETAARLTGLSVGRLLYWDRTKFFRPSLGHENRREANSRVYSFRDLLALHVLKVLRIDRKVSLPHLRDVKTRLGMLTDDEWGRRTLYVLGRRVVFDDDDGKRREAVTGQGVMDIPLATVRRNMEDVVAQEARRTQSQFGQSVRQRGVAHSREVFAGTRIPLTAVESFVSAGYSDEAILAEYPSLIAADIRLVRERAKPAA